MRRWTSPDARAAYNHRQQASVPVIVTKQPPTPPYYQPPVPGLPATAHPYLPPAEMRQDEDDSIQRIQPETIVSSHCRSPHELLTPPHSADVVMELDDDNDNNKATDNNKSNKAANDNKSNKAANDNKNNKATNDNKKQKKKNSSSSPVRQRNTPKSLSKLLFSAQQEANGDQMKVVYQQFGDDVLHIFESCGVPKPLHPHQVVIKVEASTVSLNDCVLRRGFDFNIFDPVSLPQTPGMDVVGYIVSSNHPEWPKSTRVAALVRTGGNARYATVPSSSLVQISHKLDASQVVSLVSVYTTAYQVLKRIKQKGPIFSLLGKKVLVIGGMDAVGQALIQLCRKARAELFATAPVSQHEYVQNVLGAIPLMEDPEQWMDEVAVFGKMDYVFDGVCEDGIENGYQALHADGELIAYGHKGMLKNHPEMGLLGAPLTEHIHNLWKITYPRAQSLDLWASFQADPETYKKNLKSLCQLLKWKKLQPSISKTVNLFEVAEAHSKLETDELFGTVVCLPWDEPQKAEKE